MPKSPDAPEPDGPLPDDHPDVVQEPAQPAPTVPESPYLTHAAAATVCGVGLFFTLWFLIMNRDTGKSPIWGADFPQVYEARCPSASHYTMSDGIVRTGCPGRFS